MDGGLFFHPMDFLIIIAMGIAIWAQFRVKKTFVRWSTVATKQGRTGYAAARALLDRHGLDHVRIEPIAGTLTDHYDPMQRVVRLSEHVYSSSSIAAVSVACHEVGHALQHHQSYPMLVLRHRFFPVVSLTSGVAPILLIAGFLLQASGLLLIGILFFSCAVLFQLITLPVEFDASARARRLMVAEGFIVNAEEAGVAKVLNAAALTYVAGTLIALLELIKYIMIFTNRD
jgi:Zn-dependent membrane protease YugP